MHHLDYCIIGQRIKKCRLEQGLSQKKAAKLCNISPSFYGNIERGTKIMSLDTLVDICKALQISPNYILLDELPDTDPIILSIISKVKKSNAAQYKHYLHIIKALAEISDKL